MIYSVKNIYFCGVLMAQTIQNDLSEDLFFRYSADPILLIDAENTIADINPEACRQLQWAINDLKGRPFTYLLAEPSISKSVSARMKPSDLRLMTKSGNSIPYRVSTAFLSDTKKSVFCFICENLQTQEEIFDAERQKEDLTERLYLAEQTYKSFFNAPQYRNLLLNKDLTIVDANLDSRENTNIFTEENIGKSILFNLPPQTAENRKEKFLEVLNNGKPVHFQDSVFEGRHIYYDNLYFPVFDSAGELVNIGVIMNELTEEKIREVQIAESRKRYQEMVNFIPNIVLETDALGTINYINARGQDKLKLTAEKIQEKPLLLCDLIHPSERERFLHFFNNALTRMQNPTVEFRIKIGDDTYTHLLMRAAGLERDGILNSCLFSCFEVESFFTKIFTPSNAFMKKYQLTIKEYETMMAIIEGWKNAEICERMGIANATLKTHINSLFKKLEITRREEVFLAVSENMSENPEKKYFVYSIVKTILSERRRKEAGDAE